MKVKIKVGVINLITLENKKDILARTYLVYIGMCVFALAIVWKIINLQFVEGEYWRAKAQSMNVKEFTIEAMRGDIYDVNGQLLATSLLQS